MKGSIVTGFVDLALERAFVYQEHAESKVIDMPADIAGIEKSERFAMLEKLADHDDELMEQLLSDMEPPRDCRVQGPVARTGGGPDHARALRLGRAWQRRRSAAEGAAP